MKQDVYNLITPAEGTRTDTRRATMWKRVSKTVYLALVSLVFSALFSASSSGSHLIFERGMSFDLHNATILPTSMALADLNGDGSLDIVVVDPQFLPGPVLSVYLGNGDGTFQTARVSGNGDSSVAVLAVGDLNGDGRLDVVAQSSSGTGSVMVYLGNGDGTFQDPLNSDAGSFEGLGLTLGDVNQDGKLDVVVPSNDPPWLLLLGNGDGTFQDPLALGPSTGAISPAALGDINGDGKLDLVGFPFPGPFLVFLGNGDGTFQPEAFGSFDRNDVIVLDDLNQDGKLDLVAADSSHATVVVALGNGDGTFQAGQFLGGGIGPFFLAVHDLNGDGERDIVVAARDSDNLTILVGNGDGTFQIPQTFGALAGTNSNQLGGGLWSVALGDLNNDGMPDVIAAGGVAVLRVSVFLRTTTTGGGQNASPLCTAAAPVPSVLWPANHQLVRVWVIGVTDPDGDPVAIKITKVTQDEPVNGLGDGDMSPDAIIGGSSVDLRAERSGLGNGRVYRVEFEASDGKAGSCAGAVTVGVPNSQKPGQPIVDDGQVYNSTQP
jgi:hypothetical protein